MEQIIVRGGFKLQGSVKIDGGKNVTLPILAATILADEGITTLANTPILSDVIVMNEILRSLNVRVDFNEELNEVTADATNTLGIEAKYELGIRMRASILIMGPLLARNGYAKVAMPGGCAIGKRPIDLHLKGFKALGAKIIQNNGYIEAFADELIGSNIYLDFPSVGATQNIMMAAVKAKGMSVIENVAKEPEIIELANLMNKMGAKIIGAGTSVIQIEGVETLKGVHFSIVQDRHEAGTFMIAAAMTEGDVLIEKAIPEDNLQLISKLTKMGAVIREETDGIRVIGAKVIKAIDVKTEPYPGFPTDMQAPLSAMLVMSDGVSVITETVYENRFQHLSEMQLMNADVTIAGNVATINGGTIQGADVEASDLRAAAALVLAGLRAQGVLGSAAVAVTFAERLFGYFALSIPLFVAASTFGAVNGVLLTSSRLFYAGAAQGQLPGMLTMVTSRSTPAPAVLAVAFLSLLYLTVSDIYALINYPQEPQNQDLADHCLILPYLFFQLSIGAAVLCLPVLRYTKPDMERPIKVNLFFPIIYIICTILVVAFPAFASPAETGVGCLMILTAVPVYMVLLYPNKQMPWLQAITRKYLHTPAETGVGCLMILTAVPVYMVLLYPNKQMPWLQAITRSATQLVQKLTLATRPKVK
ncbi:UDP-N-acetylglucosamine 1-carboxyvinyltransferase [Operophtera brumata]|uniref:UDP-N-acetylglucosamine 1-carboxyvinyltransferase n=1 Tax=Operophtera brumata TaxID=104452 RepID=A0A0L7LRZ7_OPEBR|nr:UDP-N-acetylglucosamine 1-carboxyvinyltransferase [Operophtera brumata]